MHFHACCLNATPDGHRLSPGERFSTDTDGMVACLGIRAETNVEFDAIVASVEAGISANTLLNPLSH